MTVLTDPNVVGHNVQEICNQLGEVSKVAATLNCLHQHATDAATGTAVAETAIAMLKYANTVARIMLVPSASATANGSNYGSVIFTARDGAGGASTTIGSVTTASVSWAPFVPVSIGTITSGALAAGSVIAYQTTKTGTGIALPSFKIFVELS